MEETVIYVVTGFSSAKCAFDHFLKDPFMNTYLNSESCW